MFRIPSHLFPCRSASTEKLLCSNLFSWKNSSCTVWQRRLSDSSAVFRAGVFSIVTGMWPQLPGLLASAVWASSFFTCTSSSCESHSQGKQLTIVTGIIAAGAVGSPGLSLVWLFFNCTSSVCVPHCQEQTAYDSDRHVPRVVGSPGLSLAG